MKLHRLDESMWWLPHLLLLERTPEQSISHKTMPTWDEHCEFMRSNPHEAWYWFAAEDHRPAGCAYLGRGREIGIGVLRGNQGQGLATEAISELMRLHPGRFVANINPANEASIALFRKLGFGGPIQITLEKP